MSDWGILHALDLQHIENQTDEICLEAVKKNGGVLQYVKNIKNMHVYIMFFMFS